MRGEFGKYENPCCHKRSTHHGEHGAHGEIRKKLCALRALCGEIENRLPKIDNQLLLNYTIGQLDRQTDIGFRRETL